LLLELVSFIRSPSIPSMYVSGSGFLHDFLFSALSIFFMFQPSSVPAGIRKAAFPTDDPPRLPHLFSLQPLAPPLCISVLWTRSPKGLLFISSDCFLPHPFCLVWRTEILSRHLISQRPGVEHSFLLGSGLPPRQPEM